VDQARLTNLLQMKFSEAYLRKRKKTRNEAPPFNGMSTETRTIPFTQLPAVIAEVRAQGKTILALNWDRNTYTVFIRNA
jgi:hypothetical protein